MSGHHDRAADVAGQTLAARRSLLGQDHESTIRTALGLATSLRAAGRLGETIELLAGPPPILRPSDLNVLRQPGEGAN